MSAGTQIDWDAAAKQAGVPLTGGASPSSTGGGIDWDAAERQAKAPAAQSTIRRAWNWMNAPNAGMEKFGEEHPALAAPMRFANAAGATAEALPKATYEMVRHPEQSAREQVQQLDDLGISKFARAHPMARMLDPTGGALSTAIPLAEGVGRNLYRGYKGGVLPEALGVGAGNVAAGKAMGEIPGAITKPIRAGMGRTADFMEAARTTPEEIGKRASAPLEAATGEKQAAIRGGLKEQRQNISPLYENLHAIDEADSPTGAIKVPEEVAEEFAPKAEKPLKLTVGEAQDLERRSTAGSNALTRRQAASQLATKMLADGMSEDDARQLLRGQFGFNGNQTEVVMREASAPGEGGGYTIAKARALRRELYDAADKAENREDFQEAKRYGQQARQLTQSMRDRAADLDPRGRLLQDFDRADQAWAQTREDQRVLHPLLDALEGRGTPSAEKFQKAWDSLTGAQRNALNRLEASGRMDLPELEKGAQTSGTVLKGTRPARTSWMDRYIKGELPARLVSSGAGVGLASLGAYEGGKHHALTPAVRAILSSLPIMGYVAPGLISPVMARVAAIRGLEDLPESAPAGENGPMRPNVTPGTIQGERGAFANRMTNGRQALPETAEPRTIGPRRQLPPSSAPSGEPINATGNVRRALPSGRFPRPVRGLLAKQNVNELPSSGEVITPGARRALPPAGSPPEAPIRTRSGNIIEGGRGKIAARQELTTQRGAEIDAEINRLEDRLWQAPNKGVAKQIQDRIRELNTEKRAILRDR